MNVSPNLASLNKDKVANKFGVQLKKKQSQICLSPTIEKRTNITTNETLADLRTPNESNGFQSILNINSSSTLSIISPNSTESFVRTSSTTELKNIDKCYSLVCNVDHSTETNSIESNLCSTLFVDEQRIPLIPMETDLSSAQQNGPPRMSSIVSTSDGQIQHQKDQPLYKRQLSKTFDNNCLMTNPIKHQNDFSTTSTFTSQWCDAIQQQGHRYSQDIVLEDDIDPPFSARVVIVKKNKSMTDEYDLMEFLGRGKFGEVKKCREKSTEHLLAAKFIKITKESDRVEAHNEIEIMKALQHSRLLQLYDAFESKANICLIMELITGGELFERVIDEDFILTERLCELYMMQICEGVTFMHSCHIIHLDMKPENILCLNRDGHRIKIIDFGLARKFDPTKQLKVLFGTPEFVAPEVINYDRVGFGTDMWSVGVICYVLLSGLSPFMGENDNDTYANINRANYDFDDEAFTDISDEAKDFISKLLLKDKNCRLEAQQCLTHPWLTRRPKLVSTPTDEETAEKKLSTKKLRRFVIRRRWQKAVNALLALQRMGMTL